MIHNIFAVELIKYQDIPEPTYGVRTSWTGEFGDGSEGGTPHIQLVRCFLAMKKTQPFTYLSIKIRNRHDVRVHSLPDYSCPVNDGLDEEVISPP